MRIRSIKPGFWTDPTMARLTIGARLFYIGLWMVADDAGFFEWQPEQIGAEMFPYDPATRREKNIEKWAQELTDTKRLTIAGCGHAVIPTFKEHQHLAGSTRRVETHWKHHQARECPRLPADIRGKPQNPEENHGV